MPFLPRSIGPGETLGVSSETTRSLHHELAANGFAVAGTETTNATFGPDTEARVRDFQSRYKLATTGTLNQVTGGVLALSTLVTTESDRTKLRADLKDAVNKVPDSPEYNYWLARYAIMTGDYTLGASVSSHLNLTDFSDLKIDLGNAIFTTGDGPGSPRQPEVPFPENFYSYRHDVMDQHAIDTLRTVRNIPPGDAQKTAWADSAEAWLNAIEAWQQGNAESERQRYDSAVAAYDRCQQAALNYFATYPGYAFQYAAGPLAARMDELVWRLASNPQAWANIADQITWRRQLLSLAELSEFDGHVIVGADPVYRADIVYQLLYGNLTGADQPPPPTNPLGPEHRKVLMDARLLVIAAVLAPLARAEANRLRRQYAASREDLTRFLRRSIPIPNNTTLTLSVWLACEFIEIPFARLLLVETMLDQAEAQYKARASVDDENDDATKTADLARLDQLAQDFNNRQIPGDAAGNSTRPFQHLVAALTYAEILDAMSADGEYVARTRQALDSLHATVTNAVANGDVTSLAFRSIGQSVTIPTVKGIGNALPGSTSGTHPHEPYLQFNPPDGQTVMRERNPRVYALLLQAQSRLLQIWNGFNYLGYRDDYVPPWRFSYLLDRARYFSEHAKNAQRDYLNFLNNAENQEFKEMSAAQNVELEKANVQIETARVDQATKEVTASAESQKLADMNATDAQQRADTYQQFSQYADELFDTRFGGSGSLGGPFGGLPSLPFISEDKVHGFMSNYFPSADTVGTGFGDFFSGGAVSKRHEALLAHAQRGVELSNLYLAIKEAKQAALVAKAQNEVAKAGLAVAGLQRQAALLRHEFAVQNLQFMRNQILNTEQWYRMAGAIRSVGDTYLRYAIQMAFLAQQAYDFEADKRLNIIRFDYDLSDVGAMLAADFLLRDLDTLEQDLIVSQQTRQQQVRYILSLAREFPDTLQTLGDTGEVMFSLRLEQLERHFPGLLALRISSVDVQPVALMDPTRVSVELTHLGTGMVRLKGQPGNSPLNNTDLAPGGDWIPNVETEWPVKIQVVGTDTALFSGLSRQEAASLSSITANERTAFEGLPGASSWKIDMSMKENQIIPGTLADVLITFTLSGYYDSELKDAILNTVSAQRPFATTSFISVRRALPDSYYSLVHYGKLDWDVPERMLTLVGTPNELHNAAVILPLLPNGPEFGRCYCRYPVRLDVSSGTVNVLSALPEFTLAPNGLVLTGTFTGSASTQVTWDFGDNSPLVTTPTAQHTYARSGRYDVITRLVKDASLVEYRSAVVVSANHQVVAPLSITPEFAASTILPDGTVTLTISVPTSVTGISVDCSVGEVRGWAVTGPVTLKLKPRGYNLDFLAMRTLSARFYSKQRYQPTTPVNLSRGRISTNRTFDSATGVNTTTSPNQFTTQLFGNGEVVVSPVDRWTLELPVAENPWFLTVSGSDVAEFDGNELSDAILSLEFLSS